MGLRDAPLIPRHGVFPAEGLDPGDQAFVDALASQKFKHVLHNLFPPMLWALLFRAPGAILSQSFPKEKSEAVPAGGMLRSFLTFWSRRGPVAPPRAGPDHFFAELLVAEMISSCLAMNSFISA